MAILERYITQRLPQKSPPRRLVILSGARQVGKTTLARFRYEQQGGLRYLNLDSVGERARLSAVPAEGWDKAVGPAVLDEAQKLPGLFDKLKWAYDEGRIDFSVLLGSSRILLLDQVRESLAGRAFVYDLWPFTAGELAQHFGGVLPERPIIAKIALDPSGLDTIISESAPTVVGSFAGAAQAAMRHLLEWGGLPALLKFPAGERMEWLTSYQTTFLERDLSDLARLRDLESFTTCQRLAALRAGRILSFSELARDAGIPVTTARRFLRYLELSYQTFFLEPWSGNESVRLIKSPKLIWVDPGVQRVLSGQIGMVGGEQYENAIISQIAITLKTLGVAAKISYLRTSGGKEVDLVIEGRQGSVACEIKNRAKVSNRDASAIEHSRRIMGPSYKGGMVVYPGDAIEKLSETVWAVPDWILLGMG